MTIYRNDTFFFYRDVKDEGGTYVDPDSHSIKVYEPDGDQSGAEMTTPTKRDSETGKFKQSWTVPADAVYSKNWRCEWKTTKGGVSKTMVTYFEVEEIKSPEA